MNYYPVTELCKCERVCGDDGDFDGPGTCKGLPTPKARPLVSLVLVDRKTSWMNRVNTNAHCATNCVGTEAGNVIRFG